MKEILENYAIRVTTVKELETVQDIFDKAGYTFKQHSSFPKSSLLNKLNTYVRFKFEDSKGKYYCIDNNVQNLMDTSYEYFIQNINLSYPFFISDIDTKDFVLPEKWCVKGHHKEVVEYSNKYGEMPIYVEDLGVYHHYPPYKSMCTTSQIIKEGYTEITLGQFKKHVLKNTSSEPIIEEEAVLECVNQEQWDFASKILGATWNGHNDYNYANANCINLKHKTRCSKSHYEDKGFKVYTFEEWCKKFNHNFVSSDTVLDKWLEKWLEETKAKNLSLEELDRYISTAFNTPLKVYEVLPGTYSSAKAMILYEKWNSEKQAVTGIKDETMRKFRVGDSVRVIVDKPRYGWGPVKKGDVGVIVSFFSGYEGVIIKFEKTEDWSGLTSEIEIVNAEPLKYKYTKPPTPSSLFKEYEFKIDDAVQLQTTKPTYGGYHFVANDIGVIRNIYSNKTIIVDFPKLNGFKATSSDLKLFKFDYSEKNVEKLTSETHKKVAKVLIKNDKTAFKTGISTNVKLQINK
jgi:hypothetical protein